MSEAEVLDDPAPPAPRRRLRWGCLLLPLVLFLACGGFYAFLMHQLHTDLNEAIAEADRLDPDGWTLDKIEEHRKVVPDEENAALVAQQVKAKLQVANWPPPRPAPLGADGQPVPVAPGADQKWVMGDVADLPPPVQLDDALLRDMRADLNAAGKESLDAANRLPKMRDGRFPLKYSSDFISTIINSQDARAGANVLHEEAALLAQDGKIDEALGAARGIIVCGRAVGDEPLMISQLIRMSCQAMAVSTLERVLAQGEPSADELKKTQELLELEESENVLLIGLRGERAGDHQLMEAMKSGHLKLSNAAGGLGGGGTAADLFGSTLARGSHARLLRMMTDNVEAAKLPAEQQGEAFRRLDTRVKQAKVDYDVIIGLLMPATMKVSEAYRRNQAGLRCAIVAVAAERYRRDKGHWPESLDDLTPDQIKAMPTDPYDGKPLRYKHLADGVIVYSVGPDLEDNGGARNRINTLAKGTDYGFRLWDVAARRQPAAEVLPMPQEAFGPPE
jgi:hypothetical protein